MKAVAERREIINKLKWFMLIRLLLISVLLGISPFVLGLGTTPFFLLIGFLYIATVGYSVLLTTHIALKPQAYLQFLVDVVIETVILAMTGGVESGFVLLYVLSIVSASIIIGGQAGVIISITCSAFYALLGIGSYFGLISPGVSRSSGLVSDPVYISYLIFVRATIFCLLGFLVDYLANNLKKNRLELDKTKKLSEKILMQMQSGLVTTDDFGRIVYANKAAEEILGYSRREMQGESWNRFLGKPVADIDNQWLSEDAKSFSRCQIRVKRKDGGEIPIGFTVSSLLDDGGKGAGLLILFRDLTQIHRMEERMRRADRFSIAGAIVASIAHEVRNPLASIRGAVEVIKEGGSFSERDGRLMEIILRESDRLDKIVSDFLSYRDSRKGRRRRENLRELLKEVVAPMERGAKSSRSVHVVHDNGEDPVYASIDADQIKQVFVNILDNAMEAMPEGGTLRVSLAQKRSSSDGRMVARVKFADTGEGMSAERMSHLFEPFYSTKEKGSGMGLFITERIIRNHSGELEVESRDGGGAVFTITLPCEQL
jgi:two-component system sensor histidine kinase PilS (NtrC family)